MRNFNFHEYLTYTLCNDFFNYHPINEEKGQILFIDSILNELEIAVTQNLDEGDKEKIIIPYTPSIDTFFCNLTLKGDINILSSDSDIIGDATGYVDFKNLFWYGNKILSLTINVNIVSPKSRFSFDFRRTVGHELLHAYEFYRRRLDGVSFNTQYQSDLNKRLQLMMNGSQLPLS